MGIAQLLIKLALEGVIVFRDLGRLQDAANKAGVRLSDAEVEAIRDANRQAGEALDDELADEIARRQAEEASGSGHQESDQMPDA